MKLASYFVLTLMFVLAIGMTFAQTTNPLIGTRWQLVSYGDPNAPTPVITGSAVTLTFGDEAQAYGNGGCNGYGSGYRVDDNTIRFDGVMSTLMACLQDGMMEQETAYFMALQSATGYELADDQLIITYEGGQLVFVALTLANTQWQLVSYGQMDNPITPLSNTTPTLNFDETTGIGGNTGCNSFGGTYTYTLETLRFADIFQTEMFCTYMMEQEATYLGALAKANTYFLTSDTLRIRYEDNNELVFERVYVLVNTVWQLVSLDNAPTLENAPVILTFEDDTNVSGSGGCNTYGGNYAIAGRSIIFSQVFSTRMFCEGLMKQEQAYFTALEVATGYTIATGQLVITYADGKTLVFERVHVQR